MRQSCRCFLPLAVKEEPSILFVDRQTSSLGGVPTQEDKTQKIAVTVFEVSRKYKLG